MIAGDVFCTDCGATAAPGMLNRIGHRCAPGQPRRTAHLELGLRPLIAASNETDARIDGPHALGFLLRLRHRQALSGESAA